VMYYCDDGMNGRGWFWKALASCAKGGVMKNANALDYGNNVHIYTYKGLRNYKAEQHQ